MKLKCLAILSLISTFSTYAAEFNSEQLYQKESNWTVFSNNSKIRLCRVGMIEDEIKVIGSMRVHFDNDSFKISKDQIESIHTFMDTNFQKEYRIVLEGFADLEGNTRYNKQLSNQRVKNVLNVIRTTSTFFEDAKVKSIFHGESRSTVHDRVDRFVEIRIEQMRENKEQFNSVYLIDASQSMSKGYSDAGFRYAEIRKMRFPIDSIAYVVRDFKTKCNGEKLNDYDPKGPAVLKEAMLVIANNLKGQAKVILYTNALQRVSAQDQNQLNQAVQKTIKEDATTWYQF